MEKEDKVAFAVLMAVIGAVIVFLMWLVKVVGSALFGFFADTEAAEMGIKDAFPYGIGISLFIVVVFALFAGDGIVGELPTMIIGFFIFVVFFSLSIAWLY